MFSANKRISSSSESIFDGSSERAILGDPGVVSGGGKKSNWVRKKIGRRKNDVNDSIVEDCIACVRGYINVQHESFGFSDFQNPVLHI